MKNAPVRGQEAVVPEHGLGRIVDWHLPGRTPEARGDAPGSWIEVTTYYDGVRRRYDPANVRYVAIAYTRHSRWGSKPALDMSEDHPAWPG